jgi:hypothetical protein
MLHSSPITHVKQLLACMTNAENQMDYLRWRVVASLPLSSHFIGTHIVYIYHPPSAPLRHVFHLVAKVKAGQG